MAIILGSPIFKAFADNKAFLEGAALYSYEAGTTTKKNTYPTVNDAIYSTNPNVNPLILNSRGEARVVFKGITDLVLKDSPDGTTLWSFDGISETDISSVSDDDGNAVVLFETVENACNEITFTNAITGSDPVMISSTGDDTNIDFTIRAKGTGVIILDDDTDTDGSLIINGNLTATSIVSEGAMTHTSTLNFSVVPAGVISWHAGSSVPPGWLECNGATISRTTYANLFTAIGTTFGVGDGSTTFVLPNQARRVIVGKGGSGTAILANTIGSTGGAETHTLVEAEVPAHTHNYTHPNTNTASNAIGPAKGASEVTNTTSTSSYGGGGAHNNMQPSVVMMMIIRAY